MIVLAGIVISVLVLAVLAFGLPWLSVHKDDLDAIDGDPAERFSGSMRILRENTAADYDDEPPVEVSTPLTRRAELTELRLRARAAAMRRRRMVTMLGSMTLLCLVLSVFNVVPGWAVAIPVVALGAFLISARVGVKKMHRRFDEKAAQVKAGYVDSESTSMMKAVEEETSHEFSVDLTAPEKTGPLWDPIPVVTPTYVSKPLVPRTVRTIDLSAPVTNTVIIPTAERPAAGPKLLLTGIWRRRAPGPGPWGSDDLPHRRTLVLPSSGTWGYGAAGSASRSQ